MFKNTTSGKAMVSCEGRHVHAYRNTIKMEHRLISTYRLISTETIAWQ